MYKLINGFFFVGIAVLFVSSPVIVQTSSESRIANLERTVMQLQQRVSVLEEQNHKTSSASTTVGKPGSAKDVQNWRQLRIGMSERSVESLLGTPGKIDVSRYSLYWYYNYPSGGKVIFDPKSRLVTEWSEP